MYFVLSMNLFQCLVHHFGHMENGASLEWRSGAKHMLYTIENGVGQGPGRVRGRRDAFEGIY